MAVTSFMVPLRTPAPSFLLPSIEGRKVSIDDFADAPALLVMFLSNHCPYVRRIERGVAAVVSEYRRRGLAAVAVCSNDAVTYTEDAPNRLAEQAERAAFGFPYLIDETQQVAKAYRAACTPDLFVYDAARELAYRGEFDGSRPNNTLPANGDGLRAALDRVLAGEPVPEPHHPSMGCSIKWKPGTEPS
jgi:peroxiredoxin